MLLSCYQQGEQHVPYQDDSFWLLAVGLQPLKLFTIHFSLFTYHFTSTFTVLRPVAVSASMT